MIIKVIAVLFIAQNVIAQITPPSVGEKFRFASTVYTQDVSDLHLRSSSQWDLTDIYPISYVYGGIEIPDDRLINLIPNVGYVYHYSSKHQDYLYEDNGVLYLAGFREETDFLKKQNIEHVIEGVSYYRTLLNNNYMRSTKSDVALISTYSRKEIIDGHFSSIPVDVDSVRVKLFGTQTTSARKGTLNAYMINQPVFLVKRLFDCEFEVFVKFKDDKVWYDFKLEKDGLPEYYLKYIDKISLGSYNLFRLDDPLPLVTYSIFKDRLVHCNLIDKYELMLLSQIDSTKIVTLYDEHDDLVYFKLLDLPEGPYRVDIYDIANRRIANHTFGSASDNLFKFNTSDLDKGVYLCKLVDQRGLTVAYSRMVLAFRSYHNSH